MKKPTYTFRAGSRLDRKLAADAGKRLTQIAERNGRLSPEVVVEDAREVHSPLHGFFEWDRDKAAAQYRLEQARHLIRSVEVTYYDVTPTRAPTVCRAFYNIAAEDQPEPYVAAAKVFKDADMRAQLVEQALSEANAWQQRWQSLKELGDVFAALQATNRKLKRRKVAAA